MQPAETFDQPRWGTIAQGAAEFGRAPETVRAWAAKGLIPSRRIGKEYQVDLNALDRTRRGTDLGPPPRIDRRQLYARQRALADSATRLQDLSRQMVGGLSQWAARDDAEDQPEIRRAADTAMTALGALTAELRAMRARLAAEIRASDKAATGRADGEPGRGAA